MIKFGYEVRIPGRRDDPRIRQALLVAISAAATKVINQEFNKEVWGISEGPEGDECHYVSTVTLRRQRREKALK